MRDDVESARSPPRLRSAGARPRSPRPVPPPHLTCGGRERLRVKPPMCSPPAVGSLSSPRLPGAGSPMAAEFLELGASRQSFRHGGRRKGSGDGRVKPVRGSGPSCVSAPSRMSPALRGPRAQSPRCAAARAGGTDRPRPARPPPPRARAARAATGAGGCRWGRLGLPGGGVRSAAPEALARGRSSSSPRAAASRAPPVPVRPVSAQTFLRLQVSPRGRGPRRAARALIGRAGRGGASARSVPRGGAGCARPTAPRGDAVRGFPSAPGREGRRRLKAGEPGARPGPPGGPSGLGIRGARNQHFGLTASRSRGRFSHLHTRVQRPAAGRGGARL